MSGNITVLNTIQKQSIKCNLEIKNKTYDMLSTYLCILMPVSRGHIHVAQQGENKAIYCMLDYQYSVDVQCMGGSR